MPFAGCLKKFVQKLCATEVLDYSSNSQKLRFCAISLKSYLVSQFWSELAEIWTRSSLDNFEENQRGFFIMIFSGLMLIRHKKREIL